MAETEEHIPSVTTTEEAPDVMVPADEGAVPGEDSAVPVQEEAQGPTEGQGDADATEEEVTLPPPTTAPTSEPSLSDAHPSSATEDPEQNVQPEHTEATVPDVEFVHESGQATDAVYPTGEVLEHEQQQEEEEEELEFRSFSPSAPSPQPDTTFIPPTTRTLMSPEPSSPPYTFLNLDPTQTSTLDLYTSTHFPSSPLGSSPPPVEELNPASPTVTRSQTPQVTVQESPEVPAGVVLVDREDTIRQIRLALEKKDTLRSRNAHLQNRLGDYFKKKRQTDETREDPKPPTDLTTRYTTSLTSLLQLQSTLATLHSTHAKFSQDYSQKLSLKRLDTVQKTTELSNYMTHIAELAENSRTGRKVPLKVVQALTSVQDRKDGEVVAVRLENIKLRNRLRRSESLLRQKEELADGLHLIDFEQLKIENATYNEKIEDRNEDLLKLRKKITTIVQVLTHVKEKLHHLTRATSHLQSTLSTLDSAVLEKRDALPTLKSARDTLRGENVELRKRAGLLGCDGLLRDFEARVDETNELQSRIDGLRRRHAGLNAERVGVHRKIQKAGIVGGTFP